MSHFLFVFGFFVQAKVCDLCSHGWTLLANGLLQQGAILHTGEAAAAGRQGVADVAVD